MSIASCGIHLILNIFWAAFNQNHGAIFKHYLHLWMDNSIYTCGWIGLKNTICTDFLVASVAGALEDHPWMKKMAGVVFSFTCRKKRESTLISYVSPRPIEVKKLMANRVFFGLSRGRRPSKADERSLF